MLVQPLPERLPGKTTIVGLQLYQPFHRTSGDRCGDILRVIKQGITLAYAFTIDMTATSFSPWIIHFLPGSPVTTDRHPVRTCSSRNSTEHRHAIYSV